MDPNATLALILSETDKDEAAALCEDLAGWLRRGGFCPKMPEGMRYWPGTGTGWAILSPGPDMDNPNLWYLVRYDFKGERVETYALFTPDPAVRIER